MLLVGQNKRPVGWWDTYATFYALHWASNGHFRSINSI